MKKLYRSRKDKVIGGVCGGIAEYFDTDPVWVRLVTVLVVLMTGVGLLVYIIAWIIVPENPNQKVGMKTAAEKVVSKVKADKKLRKTAKQGFETIKTGKQKGDGASLFGLLIVIVGLGMLFQNIFSWFTFNYAWPLLIIVIGVYLFRRDAK